MVYAAWRVCVSVLHGGGGRGGGGVRVRVRSAVVLYTHPTVGEAAAAGLIVVWVAGWKCHAEAAAEQSKVGVDGVDVNAVPLDVLDQSTARKDSVLAAKAVEHTRQRHCPSHQDGSGTHKADAVSYVGQAVEIKTARFLDG